MLKLRDTSKITLLVTLIIAVSAAGAVAKGRQDSKGRDRPSRQPQQAKQPQATPGQTAQNRKAAPQNPRSMETNRTRPQGIRQVPVVRQPNTLRPGNTARTNINPRTNTNFSGRQPRTFTKTIAPRAPVTTRSVVSPRLVNKEVKTVTRTELKKAVKTIAPSAPARQPVSMVATKPSPIRRQTEVRGKPLTERRQGIPIATKPVKTPSKETSRNRAERKSYKRVTRAEKTVVATETSRRKGGLHGSHNISHGSHNINHDKATSDRRIGSGFNRPRVSKTTVVANDTSHRRGGLHGGHNINHDKATSDSRVGSRFNRPRVSKTTVVVGDTSHRAGRHSIRHDRRISGRRPGRIFSRIVWPSYRYRVCYNWGPRVIWRYVRPYYHRKYVFVSIGGWWPVYYRPLRYYYYSWHPYRWYGCYPTVYRVTGDTFNYYTYNTYVTGQAYSTAVSGPLEGVDETTFEDVRQRLAEQAAEEPDPETLADKFFEEGVEAFEEGDYEAASKAFADATVLEPNDLVLPFAYAQALFADQQYYEAAEILRLALANLPPDKEGIFFPRGLYADDEILLGQIEQLKEKTEIFPFDADFKFLLGYQYIGIGQYDQAEELLTEAARYERNNEAAEILLRLLEKIKEMVETEV